MGKRKSKEKNVGWALPNTGARHHQISRRKGGNREDAKKEAWVEGFIIDDFRHKDRLYFSPRLISEGGPKRLFV